MKKIYLIIFSFICLFGCAFGVKANELNSINTTVYIDQNGDGHVTEVWDLTANEGTESYHSFGNLEDREITDFKVSMDGTTYTRENTWNVNASKSAKAYKNGINYTSDGLELCWGIEYGTHTYTLNYIIKDLVWQYSDRQILYFSFLPQNMDPAPREFQITFKGDTAFTDIKYSSYGFNSENAITNGEVVLKSKGNMSSNEYVVALIGFPNSTFNLDITKSGTYDTVVDEALEGAKLNESKSFWNTFIPIVLTASIFGLVIFALVQASKSKDRIDKTEFIIPKDINNFRDIPFDKDILKAYYVGKEESIMKEENIMGAIILKWIKEKKIEMVPTEKDGILDFNKDDNYYIDITKLQNLPNNIEANLASILNVASNNSGKVKPKDFEKYSQNHYQKIERWLEDAESYSKSLLINEGYIITGEENYSKNGKRKVYKFTAKLRDEFIKLKGLKQFLEDMTLIDEKKAIEVHVWDEYLIFAESLGIADKVAKQFEKFHPAEYSQSNYYHSYYWVSSFSTHSVSAAMRARSAASSGGSFSGGGMSSGGFSSGGGGVR